MHTKTQKRQPRSVRKKNSKSSSNRKSFLALSVRERRNILRNQSEKIAQYYINENEWKEFEAFDLNGDF